MGPNWNVKWAATAAALAVFALAACDRPKPVEIAQKTVPAADPFRQPPSPSWPRALVPMASDAGGFNVRYDETPAADPFQPRAVDPPAAGER